MSDADSPLADGFVPGWPEPDWTGWLRGRQRRALDLPGYRPAAVLVGVTRGPDPQLLLTVRSADLPTHQGQISFPGGRLEPGEDAVQAALREAWEEVGLDPGAVEVLGLLDDAFTPVGFHVTPVLARLDDEAPLKLSGEVAQILRPSLRELRATPPRVESRVLPGGQVIPLYRYPWQGHDIWGMTARIIHDLLQAPH